MANISIKIDGGMNNDLQMVAGSLIWEHRVTPGQLTILYPTGEIDTYSLIRQNKTPFI